MRAKDIIDSLCEVDQSRRGFLKRLGTIAGGLAVSPATVASATSPKLLVVAPPEMWNYGSPTGLPHSDDYSEVFDLATQTTPLEGNVAKFFADKGYGFTASGQLVLTPEKAKRVSHLADILGGHNVDQNTWNAIHSWPRETQHEHPLLQQIYAEQSKARRELQGFDDSILSSYKQAFGKKMEYTQDTIDRSEAWAKRINDYNKKWHEDRRRADAEKKKEQDSLKYSRMDYAGGSEDVQGVDYTTQESVMATTGRILGEARPPTEKELTSDAVAALMALGIKPIEAHDSVRAALAILGAEATVEQLIRASLRRNPLWAYVYARDVLKGRWPESEAVIATAPQWAYEYAKYVIKGPFPEGEPAIATDPGWAYNYVIDVLKHRWPEAEANIRDNGFWAFMYAKDVLKGRWPEAEEAIAKDPRASFYYATEVIMGRWPEAEAVIATDPRGEWLNKEWMRTPPDDDGYRRSHGDVIYGPKSYLDRFPEARLTFAMNGWLDWLDL
jgi:hypothetical protein